jgi:hypothetical protein
MSEQNGVTHYVMSSAFEIDGTIKVAGTVLTAEQIESHPRFEMLIADEHIRPCAAPGVEKPTKPSFTGRKRKSEES